MSNDKRKRLRHNVCKYCNIYVLGKSSANRFCPEVSLAIESSSISIAFVVSVMNNNKVKCEL